MTAAAASAATIEPPLFECDGARATVHPPPEEITRSAGIVMTGGRGASRHVPAEHVWPVGQRTVAHESSEHAPVTGLHACPRGHVVCGPHIESTHIPVAGLHT